MSERGVTGKENRGNEETGGSAGRKGEVRDVFDAIADPTRRRILQLLAEADELALHELTPHFAMGRTAVSKHLAVLKQAGLVVDRRVGRETLFRLNAAPLQEVQDWVAFYRRFWTANLERLKQLVEEDDDQ